MTKQILKQLLKAQKKITTKTRGRGPTSLVKGMHSKHGSAQRKGPLLPSHQT